MPIFLPQIVLSIGHLCGDIRKLTPNFEPHFLRRFRNFPGSIILALKTAKAIGYENSDALFRTGEYILARVVPSFSRIDSKIGKITLLYRGQMAQINKGREGPHAIKILLESLVLHFPTV